MLHTSRRLDTDQEALNRRAAKNSSLPASRQRPMPTAPLRPTATLSAVRLQPDAELPAARWQPGVLLAAVVLCVTVSLQAAPLRAADSASSVAAPSRTPALVLAQAPARETPRPQDIDPGVNTSAPSQTPSSSAAESPSSSTPSGAAPANAAGSSSSSAAPAARSAPAAKPAGAASSPGSASTPSTSSTPNSSAATKPGATGKGKALDRLELDATQITGNRELPKVLYIVPWKRADLGDLVGKPVNSLLDEVLTPVDRDVFKRENRYYRALTPGETPPNATNPSSSAAPETGSASPAATSSGNAAQTSRDER